MTKFIIFRDEGDIAEPHGAKAIKTMECVAYDEFTACSAYGVRTDSRQVHDVSHVYDTIPMRDLPPLPPPPTNTSMLNVEGNSQGSDDQVRISFAIIIILSHAMYVYTTYNAVNTRVATPTTTVHAGQRIRGSWVWPSSC